MAVSQIIGASIADGTIAAIDITDGTITTAKLSATTGSGNVVLSAAPTLTGNTSLVNLTVSGTQTNSTLTSGRVRYSTTGGVLTDSSNLQFDGSNLGLGVTPNNAWNTFTALQISTTAVFSGQSGAEVMRLGSNWYYSSGVKYIGTGYSTLYEQSNGSHFWYNAPSGTAGNAITFTQAMTLDASGHLGIGTTSPSSYGGLAVRKAATVSSVPVSASFSDSANSTFDIRHSPNIVNLNAQGSGLTIDTGNHTQMTITSTGLVGINTTSPSQLLHLNVSSGNIYEQISSGANNVYVGFETSRTAATIQSNNPLVFDVGSAYTERMRITSAGLVGIGTTGPLYKLDVNSGSANGSGIVTILNLKNPGENYGDGAKLLFTAGASTTGGCAIGSYGTSLNAADMVFYAGGNTEKLRLTATTLYTAAGVSVGIGASDPNYQLHVTTSFAVGLTGFNQQLSFTNDTIQSLLLGTGYSPLKLNPLGGSVLVGATSTVDSAKVQFSGAKTLSSGIPQGQLNIADTTAIAVGVGGAIAFSALYNGSSYTTMGSVEGVRETATVGHYGGNLVFRTRTNFGDNTERMRIDSSGNVGLTTSAYTLGSLLQLGRVYSFAQDINSGYTGAGWIGGSAPNYAVTGNYAVREYFDSALGEIVWQTAGTGTAAGAVSFNTKMTLKNSGNLGIGQTSPSAKIDVATTTAGYAGIFTNTNAASDSNGILIKAGSVSTEYSLRVATQTDSATLFTVKGNGNVGIGTSSPAAKLSVTSTSTVDGIQITTADVQYIKFLNSSTKNWGFATTNLAASDFGIYQATSNGGDPISAGTARLYFDGSGNVGIGTTSPSARLQLGDGSSGTLKFRIHRGAGTDYTEYFSDTGSTVIDTVGGGSVLLRFGGTERMQLTAGGLLFLGTTSTYDSAYTMSLRVYNATGGLVIKPDTDSYTPISFRNAANAQVGSISATSSATAYNTSSDYRLKEDIAPMTGALVTIAQLKPVTYKWKSNGFDGQGFIAHELAEVVPDCVTGEKDAVDDDGKIKPQGVDTSFLVATLTAAIQEQQALIESLTTRLTALEGK